MDLNGDGHTDILSGSYSRYEGSMAGLFQVLYGKEGGGFAKATTLNGTNGEPLIMDLPPAVVGDDLDLGRICTRAWAVDLTGDGKLDLVSGNFGGTFAMFAGEGGGKFAPTCTVLRSAEGKELGVDLHSDPCFVDWDGDGDQDLVSGSDNGAVSMFPNVTKDGAIAFGSPVVLVASSAEGGPGAVEASAGKAADETPVFGMEHIQGPGHPTRVAVADINGDGKLDLLVGDYVKYFTIKDGVSEEDAIAAMRAFQKALDEMAGVAPPVPADWDNLTDAEAEALEAYSAKALAIEEAKNKSLVQHGAGFVWLYTQK